MGERSAAKKPAAILLGLVVLGVLLVVAVSSQRPRELVFQGKSVSAWAYQLYGPIEREHAAAVFQELGEQAVPDLVRMLQTRDRLLVKVLYPPPNWLPEPLRMLIRRSIRPADVSTRRRVAANAVAALGPMAAPAVPELERMFVDGNTDERWEAARALGRVGTTNAARVCLAALRGTNVDFHHPAIYALSEMGRNAILALPEVLACLGHPQAAVRAVASHTLGRVGTPTLEPLLEIIHTRRGLQRRTAAEALSRHWPSPRIAVPPLLDMLTDPDPLSRLQAVEGLRPFVSWRAEVASAFTNLLDDADASVRGAAAKALAIDLPPPE